MAIHLVDFSDLPESDIEKRYTAGAETARTDINRGLSIDDMFNVPRLTDHEAWARGYREEANKAWLEVLG